MNHKAVKTSLLLALILGWAIVSETGFAVMGKCGKPLPRGRDRHAKDIKLICSSSTDTFVRNPIPFDVENWLDAEDRGDRSRMQQIGQDQPRIKWRGAIPYETKEQWTWEKRVTKQNEEHCGSHTKTWKDKDGVEHEVKIIHTCTYEEDQYEERFCSSLNMTFSAEYVRPSLEEWNPSVRGYYDTLPNKYDLLPGEVEAVNIYNTWWSGETLKPWTEVADAWNKYDIVTRFDDGSTAKECVYDEGYSIHIDIHTVGRIKRKTPNAFRNPTNEDGEEIERLAWEKGMPEGSNEQVRTVPYSIRLTDASAVLIESLARHSRKFTAELERQKRAAGLGQSTDIEELRKFEDKLDNVKKTSAFYKDTYVRVRLWKKMKWARDILDAEPIYLRGAEVGKRGKFNIPLREDGKRDAYKQNSPILSSLFNGFHIKLEPDADYGFWVSMFQKGVPFYNQESWAGEGNWYSNELEVAFHTDPNWDTRNWFDKYHDWRKKNWLQKLGLQK